MVMKKAKFDGKKGSRLDNLLDFQVDDTSLKVHRNIISKAALQDSEVNKFFRTVPKVSCSPPTANMLHRNARS
jgi:hypothetical protein